jgi:hypothetical protein
MRRFLFVTTGEAFRGLAREAQSIATKSHLALFQAFPTVHWDVFINSYANPQIQSLIEMYPNVVRSTIHPALLGEYGLIDNTTQQLGEMDLSVYDGILFVRIDFFLRDAFFNVFRPTEDHIVYAHLDANEASNDNIGPHPGVCHNIVCVPREFVPLLCQGSVWRRHISLNIAARYTSRIRFYSNTYHSCNTATEWNPFYVMVDRSETNVFLHNGISYDFHTRKKHHLTYFLFDLSRQLSNSEAVSAL